MSTVQCGRVSLRPWFLPRIYILFCTEWREIEKGELNFDSCLNTMGSKYSLPYLASNG